MASAEEVLVAVAFPVSEISPLLEKEETNRSVFHKELDYEEESACSAPEHMTALASERGEINKNDAGM